MGIIKDLAGGFYAGTIILAVFSFLRIGAAFLLIIKKNDDREV